MDDIYLWQKHQSKQEQQRNQNFPLEPKIDVFVVAGATLLCETSVFVVSVSEN